MICILKSANAAPQLNVITYPLIDSVLCCTLSNLGVALVMYDVTKLKTVLDCRTVMQRARQRNVADVYEAVFRRMCHLAGFENDDPDDPLVRDFYETLAAYEQLLTEKNGHTTAASRTRQKITNKDVYQSLIDWTRGKVETNGFRLLVEAGFHQYTGEYLVARYANRFPEDVVRLARDRLSSHGIDLPNT